jgi:hypothetical protein
LSTEHRFDKVAEILLDNLVTQLACFGDVTTISGTRSMIRSAFGILYRGWKEKLVSYMTRLGAVLFSSDRTMYIEWRDAIIV